MKEQEKDQLLIDLAKKVDELSKKLEQPIVSPLQIEQIQTQKGYNFIANFEITITEEQKQACLNKLIEISRLYKIKVITIYE